MFLHKSDKTRSEIFRGAREVDEKNWGACFWGIFAPKWHNENSWGSQVVDENPWGAGGVISEMKKFWFLWNVQN